MSRRISLKKLGQKLEESKSESSMAKSTPTKGVVIGKKHPREASITSPNEKGSTSSPNKKGKTIDSSKGKEIALPLEAKKTETPQCGDHESYSPTKTLGGHLS